MIPARVAIGSHRYVVDLENMARRPINSLRQAVDQGGRASDQSLDNQALWKRTCSDFILGQGQEFFDQEQESNERRMWAVQNFDPLADRRALATSPSFGSAVSAFTAAGTHHRLIRTASNFWWGSESQLHRSASHTSFTTTSITGGPGVSSFRDMTVFGSTVYVAYSTAVYSGSTTGSTVSSFSTEDCDVICAELGRLVCGKDNALFELSSTGTRVDILTHPNTALDWISFTAGTAGIYCAGHDGLRSEIYLITVIDATGALAPPFPVCSLPAGELVRRIMFFGGFLVIATSKGVRMAQASQSGLLSYGPLIELGDTYGVHFEGRFAYVACSSVPVFDNPGVVALDMSRFTAPLTPAYAAVEVYDTASTYTVWDVSSYNGLVCALMGTGGNNELRIASTASPATYGTGKFWSGAITFGTPEAKNFYSLEVTYDALPSGCSVIAKVYDTVNGTEYGSMTDATAGSTGMTFTLSSELRGEQAQVYLEAAGSSNGAVVTIRRWTLRAVVAPTYLAEEIILPIHLAKEVLTDDGTIVQYDPEAEWQYLSGLMRSRTAVDLRFGNETVPVWVDQVGTEQGWTKWDERDQWPEGFIFVRLLTLEQS